MGINNLTYRKSNVTYRAGEEQSASFLPTFIRWSWIILFACSFFQLVFFWTVSNLFAIVIVNTSWFLFNKVILRPNILPVYPFSSFLILGFVATQFYLPTVFTIIEGKPVVFNLDVSYQVFIHAFFALLMFLLAHIVYRSMSVRSLSKSRELLAKTPLFTVPTETQLWSMGMFGLLAMFYVYFYSPSVGRTVSGVADKLIQGFIPFTYAPFFIPFSKLYSGKAQEKSVLMKLILFAVLLFIVSLGRNSRGGFMMGFTALGFSYLLGVLTNIFKFKAFSIQTVFFGVGLVYLLTGPLSDLGTAMILVRSQREEVDRTQLIALTLDKFQDKEAISQRNNEDLETERDWDEKYVDNLFLARFSNLKYSDAGLQEAMKIQEGDRTIFDFSIDRILVTLPTPILNMFAIKVDKQKVNGMSFGDYLHYRAGAGISALGGFRSGHFAGIGMAAFGWYYLVVLAILITPVFFLLDNFCYVIKDQKTASYTLRFSLCGLLLLTSIFMFFPMESVTNIANYLLRGWVQSVFLYLLIFYITAKISRLFAAKRTIVFKK